MKKLILIWIILAFTSVQAKSTENNNHNNDDNVVIIDNKATKLGTSDDEEANDLINNEHVDEDNENNKIKPPSILKRLLLPSVSAKNETVSKEATTQWKDSNFFAKVLAVPTAQIGYVFCVCPKIFADEQTAKKWEEKFFAPPASLLKGLTLDGIKNMSAESLTVGGLLLGFSLISAGIILIKNANFNADQGDFPQKKYVGVSGFFSKLNDGFLGFWNKKSKKTKDVKKQKSKLQLLKILKWFTIFYLSFYFSLYVILIIVDACRKV